MNDFSTSFPGAQTSTEEWDIYFFTHFEGPSKLKTSLIHGLAARICGSSSTLKKKIEKHGITPDYEILRELKPNTIVEDLKQVAKDNRQVRKLIVAFVRNREGILGEERKEDPNLDPAVREEAVVEVDRDGRVLIASRGRTFEEIVKKIGTSRSRRVERAMRRAEERRQLVDGNGNVEMDCGAGLEVSVSGGSEEVGVADTMASGAEGMQKGGKTRGGERPANWLERLQDGDSDMGCGQASALPGICRTHRARSLSAPSDRVNPETRPQDRAKSEMNGQAKVSVSKLGDTSGLVKAVKTDQSDLLKRI